jgi:PIN domain nuclease of toxin-antitoxin system
MNVLLDTHAIVWFIEGDPSLSKKAKEIIVDGSNAVSVSMASFYEMAIKLKIKKLELKDSLKPFLEKVKSENISILSITESHLVAYETIPMMENHRDPFDRLIIATGLVENLSIVTIDKQFSQYSKLVPIIW